MKTVVDAANIKAKIFLPDKAYMDTCVDVAGVREHLKGKKSSVPLYMIIGVATANKVDIEEESSREISGGVAGGLDAVPAVPGLQAQAEVQASNTRNAASTLKIEEECDFAYRIREFSYWRHRRSKVKDKGDRTEGALFGTENDNGYEDNDDDDDDDENMEDVALFNDFKDDDVGGSAEGHFTFDVMGE
ncbi:hypothetical protein BGZ57DRAFT_963245 [Hyaloscypha finlandica]|nr:hypothetical protein BGZ57DRAFT_963245 [Hyaloscypha finlandica]